MKEGLYNIRTLKAELEKRGIKPEDADFRISPKSKKIFLMISPTEIIWTGDKTSSMLKAGKLSFGDLLIGESDWKDEYGDIHTSTYIFYNPTQKNRTTERKYRRSGYDSDDYRQHYEEYAGTYAQDVAGYSDEAIDAAFDGEPDAYWNID